MKKLVIAAFALTAAVSVFAQGTVGFGNYNALGTTHFWGPSSSNPGLSLQGLGVNDSPVGTNDYALAGMTMIGASGVTTRYGSQTTRAELLWANGAGAAEASLQPSSVTTTFRTGTTVGRITLITATITGLIPDSAAGTFQMVAWDNFSGLYPTWADASVAWQAGLIAAGKSTPFTVNLIGGSVNTTPIMLPPSFNLYMVPEPSSLALAGLGAAALMIFRRRK